MGWLVCLTASTVCFGSFSRDQKAMHLKISRAVGISQRRRSDISFAHHMGNARNSFLWIVGKGFLGSEIVMDIKIQSEDGPNGGSVLADVIRATKVALNQGAAGAIEPISAYGFKNPPVRSRNPGEADRALANFILGVK